MEDVIKISGDRYPALLKNINNPPSGLYYKGEWNSDIFENCLGVVGSRRMTAYGKETTHRLVSEIAAAGITIVSGFMFGIDAEGHRAALEGNGKTVAVMPCGIDIIHPSYQKRLQENIIKEGGMVISEFERKFPPRAWTYPRRNRIVAGLSKAVMVVEAAEKSGSLITANFAKEFERKVFAVPGPLSSKVSEGTNRLIKEGAEIVTGAEDIIKFFGLDPLQRKEKYSRTLKLSSLESSILEKLGREPMRIDDLSRFLGKPVSEIGTALSMMQIRGLVREEEGKYHPK